MKNIWGLVERFRPRGAVERADGAGGDARIPPGNADISSLQYAAGGGSAIPVAVGKAIQDKLKLPVLEVYGMTETSSVHTIAYPDRPIRLGSVGLPMPYSRVRIVKLDADGRFERDCATDEIGVVIMAGPGVFGGYLNDAHNEGAFVDEVWVNSGDLGRLDADGYLWITGRAKDLVIRGGHNIDPGADRGDHVPASRRRLCRRGRPARRLCRRTAGRLCAIEAGRERAAGRTRGMGARAHARARRRSRCRSSRSIRCR